MRSECRSIAEFHALFWYGHMFHAWLQGAAVSVNGNLGGGNLRFNCLKTSQHAAPIHTKGPLAKTITKTMRVWTDHQQNDKKCSGVLSSIQFQSSIPQQAAQKAELRVSCKWCKQWMCTCFWDPVPLALLAHSLVSTTLQWSWAWSACAKSPALWVPACTCAACSLTSQALHAVLVRKPKIGKQQADECTWADKCSSLPGGLHKSTLGKYSPLRTHHFTATSP